MTAELPQVDARTVRKETVAAAWVDELERERVASDAFLDARLRVMGVTERAALELADYVI